MKEHLFAIFRKVTRTLGGHGLGLAHIPGANALYQKLYARLRPSDIVLVDAQGSKMYVKPDDSFISSAIINVGTWEAQETALFYSLIKPGMTVLDIGANMGYYSLLAAKLVGDKGHVYAFEPDPFNYQLILKSVAVNNYRNVTAFNQAVADKPGHVKLYLESSNWGHSLSAQNINNPSGAVDVEMITLDSLYADGKLGSKIDFIKIDIQGAEEMAMNGARKLLQDTQPTIAMELEPARLVNMGADSLRLLRLFEHMGYNTRVIETDLNLPANPTLENIVAAAEKTGMVNVLLTPPVKTSAMLTRPGAPAS
jgi:FkbM family methyltransferase